MSTHADLATFVEALRVAVPLLLAELDAVGDWARSTVTEKWRAAAVDAITARGDILQYGSKRRGEVAAAFNAAAKGVAVGATAPGGIVVCGVVFCAAHARTGTTPVDGMCRRCLDEATVPATTAARPVATVYLPGDAPGGAA